MIVTKASEALRLYGERVGPVNATQNVAIVRRWLLWGGRPSDAHLAAYIGYLRAQGLASGTIDLHQRVIRSFYRHLGIHAPRAQYRHDQSTERRPAASMELVGALVNAAKAGDIGAAQASHVALCSTYGMRVGEVAAVERQDVDLDGRRVFVRTEKGGVHRWMHMPDAVAPYLDIAWMPRDPDAVNAGFADALAAIGVMRTKGDRLGLHILRRGLVLALVQAGVPESDISVFMRWSSGGKGVRNATAGAGEVGRYSDPSALVGVGGETQTRPVLTVEEQDAAVWERHPWIGLWG